jgi:hypothetical protein
MIINIGQLMESLLRYALSRQPEGPSQSKLQLRQISMRYMHYKHYQVGVVLNNMDADQVTINNSMM